VLNEYDRLKGILSTRKDPSLNDGRALKTRMSYLEKRMTDLKSQPLAGPEGLYRFLCYFEFKFYDTTRYF
jgi:hypothetical protein